MKNTNLNMVQNIIKKAGISKELLLTGTPSEFVKNDFENIFISFEELMSVGMVSNFRVEMVSSTYNFKKGDFVNGDVKAPEGTFNPYETNATLDSVLEKIMLRLKKNLDWNQTIDSIGKTMIACRNQEQAKLVHKYFTDKGVSSYLSISDSYFDEDTSAEVIQDFKDGVGANLLIVVRRGILGYNDTKLYNIVDMTCSRNINRVFQLVGRITRKDNANPQAEKLFIKIAPFNADTQYKYFMTLVICLFKREYFIKFDGNYKQMYIPVVRKNKQVRKAGVSKHKLEDCRPIDFLEGVSINADLFRDIDFNKNSEYSTYAYAKYEDIENFLNGLLPEPESIQEVIDFIKKNNINGWVELQSHWHKAWVWCQTHNADGTLISK